MKRLFKIFILLVLVLNFNQLTYAKPLPPGSGEGDVPANILILLDSSKSMKNRIGDLKYPNNIQLPLMEMEIEF